PARDAAGHDDARGIACHGRVLEVSQVAQVRTGAALRRVEAKEYQGEIARQVERGHKAEEGGGECGNGPGVVHGVFPGWPRIAPGRCDQRGWSSGGGSRSTRT